MSAEAKKILLFLDGTGNHDSGPELDHTRTNVVLLRRIIQSYLEKKDIPYEFFDQSKNPEDMGKMHIIRGLLAGNSSYVEGETRFAIPEDSEDFQYHIYYNRGIGTSEKLRKIGGLTATALRGIQSVFPQGLDKDIQQAYHYLCDTYEPGAEVSMFGFSRGSLTARSLLGLIRTAGVLRFTDTQWLASEVERDEVLQNRNDLSDDEKMEAKKVMLVQEAFAMYRDKTVTKNMSCAVDFRKNYSWTNVGDERLVAKGKLSSNEELSSSTEDDNGRYVVPVKQKIKGSRDNKLDLYVPEFEVKFLGLWDTVAAVKHDKHVEERAVGHHYHHVGKIVKVAMHALALDDRRKDFSPLLWEPSRKRLTGKRRRRRAVDSGYRRRQTWFAGAHSDVGGSYASSGLSDIALVWMMQKFAKYTDSNIVKEAIRGIKSGETIEYREKFLDERSIPEDQRIIRIVVRPDYRKKPERPSLDNKVYWPTLGWGNTLGSRFSRYEGKYATIGRYPDETLHASVLDKMRLQAQYKVKWSKKRWFRADTTDEVINVEDRYQDGHPLPNEVIDFLQANNKDEAFASMSGSDENIFPVDLPNTFGDNLPADYINSHSSDEQQYARSYNQRITERTRCVAASSKPSASSNSTSSELEHDRRYGRSTIERTDPVSINENVSTSSSSATSSSSSVSSASTSSNSSSSDSYDDTASSSSSYS